MRAIRSAPLLYRRTRRESGDLYPATSGTPPRGCRCHSIPELLLPEQIRARSADSDVHSEARWRIEMRTGVCGCTGMGMASHLFARSVRDSEFVARVRRHPPSSLVPLVAAIGAQYSEQDSWLDSPYMKFTPWALAEITRVSLCFGNEHRGQPADVNDVLQCAAAFSALTDSELKRNLPGALGTFLLRVSGQQFAYQRFPLFELGRSCGLFLQTTPTKPVQVLADGWDLELFGCTLQQYLATGFLLHTAAVKGAGRVDLDAILSQPGSERITDTVPANIIRDALARNFTTDIAGFKQANPHHRAAGELRRFSFNPLRSTPAIAGMHQPLIVPVPGEIYRKLSPVGIYYAGVAKWGDRFAQDLGDLFEQYVGRLLSIRDDCQVHPEIAYGKDNRKSVDWILVDDEAVVLVEAKSVRPTETVRMGTAEAGEELARKLQKAHHQINVTDELITQRHPAFADIPTDRPRVGLVVTMEPFDAVNMPWIHQMIVTAPQRIPTTIASVHDLERLVTIDGLGVGQFLHILLNDPHREGWSVGTALNDVTTTDNPVVRTGFDAFPWKP
ncbi:hypothetical protein ACQPZ2_30730 [Nocardia pseudovaccinii]|uniref:hypothetical protein n=1 Tax=Nocardia pseudovaccinii TaxID=189540 RepID=UPI003D8AF81C